MAMSLVTAAGLAAFGARHPEAEIADAVERTPGRSPALAVPPPATFAGAKRPASAEQPEIHEIVPRERLLGDDDASFGSNNGGTGSPFSRQDWAPPPPPPAPLPQASTHPPPEPPPPSAPPLPFTFLGKSVSDGVWEVYLARGAQTYVVREKATIEGVYRVDSIVPPTISLTYLPLNQVQQLNIGAFE
jgi:hypothetical protein